MEKNMLKEKMYLRFNGMINRVLEIDEDYIVFEQNWFDDWADEISSMKIDLFLKEYQPRYSMVLGELLEVGDFLDNYYITAIKDETVFLGLGFFIAFDDIEDLVGRVVTHEMFDQVSFKK